MKKYMFALSVISVVAFYSCKKEEEPEAPYNSFTGNSGIFVDSRDNQTYPWVRIGTQIWMAKNLNTGTMIQSTQSQTNNNVIEKYAYNNDPTKISTYGGLYSYMEMRAHVLCGTPGVIKGIAPDGWHIPNNDEWVIFKNYVAANPTINLNDASGFAGLMCGRYYYSDQQIAFEHMGSTAYFWQNSEYCPINSFYMRLLPSNGNVSSGITSKRSALSVRCIKDN